MEGKNRLRRWVSLFRPLITHNLHLSANVKNCSLFCDTCRENVPVSDTPVDNFIEDWFTFFKLNFTLGDFKTSGEFVENTLDLRKRISCTLTFFAVGLVCLGWQLLQSKRVNLGVKYLRNNSCGVFRRVYFLFFSLTWVERMNSQWLAKLYHPPRDWWLTEAFKNTPRDDVMQEESLRLHRLIQAVGSL